MAETPNRWVVPTSILLGCALIAGGLYAGLQGRCERRAGCPCSGAASSDRAVGAGSASASASAAPPASSAAPSAASAVPAAAASCVRLTACPQGVACDTIPDGCGGRLTCGTCAAGTRCENGTCVKG